MKKHYTTKENLLDICKACARKKGINGFGMRDVSRASGLALGTIYNYFKDKESMIIETLLSIWKEFISSIPLTDYFLDYLNNVINVVDNIEAIYPNFIKHHPRNISETMLPTAREMMNDELLVQFPVKWNAFSDRNGMLFSGLTEWLSDTNGMAR